MICPNCKSNINPSNGRCPNCSFPLPGLDLSNNNIPNLQINNNISDLSTINDLEEFNRNFSLKDDFNLSDTSKVEVDEKEKKKDNKKSPMLLVIIFLILIILLLGSYLLYDKFINNDKNFIVKTETTKEYKLTKQEAKGLGNYLWNYALDTIWCHNFTYSEQPTLINESVNGFEITNYDEIVKNFTTDFIYEYQGNTYKFNDIFGNNTIENKYYDVNKCNRESDPTYETTTLEIKLISKDEITYKATSTYCEGEACIENNIEKEFVIVKEKNKWKIKQFFLPN